MSDVVGKATALNTISPMKTWATYRLRIVFKLVPYLSATRKLEKLSFIHFARWVIIRPGEFPHLSPNQKRDRTVYSYLLFCSNFNGPWDEYIAAFSDIIPDGINRIWRPSRKFPRARPLIPFQKYIRHNQLRTSHYYAAYPGASTTDVKNALKLRDALIEFHARSRDFDPHQFKSAYREFLSQYQDTFGSTGRPPGWSD